MSSFVQNNRDYIGRAMLAEIQGIDNPLALSIQFSTNDPDLAMDTLRKFKQRYARKIVLNRRGNLPLIGSLEVRGHLHFHGITKGPHPDVASELNERISKLILGKIPNVHRLGHKFRDTYDDAGWIKYCTKFEDVNDLLVWI